MSGASDTLDPIAAAEAGIAGSKNLMAAVADDLSQQERWLAHYRVAEKRHARRIVLQEVMYRLERGLDRLMRVSRRLVLLSLRSARWLSGVIASWLASLLAVLRHAAMDCIIWLRPRMHRLALLLRIRLAAFWAWSVATSRLLARASLDAASLGLAWLARQSQALAIALHEWFLTAAAFTAAKAKLWARVSVARASAGYSYAARNMSRILHETWHAARRAENLMLRRCTVWARVSVARASAGYSYAAHNMSRILHSAWRVTRRTEASARALALRRYTVGYSYAARNMSRILHSAWRLTRRMEASAKALVLRRCTALACVAIPRAKLPAIRDG